MPCLSNCMECRGCIEPKMRNGHFVSNLTIGTRATHHRTHLLYFSSRIHLNKDSKQGIVYMKYANVW